MEPSRSALTLDDALPVIAEAMSENTVLVGGQAVNLWAVLLIQITNNAYRIALARLTFYGN